MNDPVETPLEIIRGPLGDRERGVLEVFLCADRHTLAKRRWRAAAEDGREFGFDLDEPLHDGAAFYYVDGTTYVVSQRTEPVLEIPLASPAESARLGWLIGNLHFSLEISGDRIHVADDSAVRQMLEREKIAYTGASRVFSPFRPGHVH